MGAGELRLTIETNRQGRTLVFKNLRSGELFPLSLTHRVELAIGAWRESFSGLLKPFHECAGKLATAPPAERWRTVEQAVRRLREISLGSLNHLTGGSTRARSLQDFLSRAIPETWDVREHPARIQLLVDGPNQELLGLPIEYLPLGRALPPQTIDNPTALQEALSLVAGFAATIAHRLDVGSSMHNYLEPGNDGKLLGKAVSHSDFHTSEAIWLDSRRSSCTVEPIWPDDSTMASDAATEVLARCLFDPRFEFRSPTPRTSAFDQLQHLSCHYELTPGTRFWRLRLRDGRPPIAIDLLSLSASLSQLRSLLSEPDDRPPGPFIFVNACHSGAAPSGVFSLAETLYPQTGARALLVTETEVEWKLAAAFARSVYAELFRGRTLGTAVHQARWELVLRDDNPFGILYTLYGDPELHCIRSATGHGFISGTMKRPTRSARA